LKYRKHHAVSRVRILRTVINVRFPTYRCIVYTCTCAR